MLSGGVRQLAHFGRQDEVLFERLNGGYLLVHLTMAGRRDPYVSIECINTWQDVIRQIQAMHDW